MMELFSRCSNCLVCVFSGGCLAGHGDNDFVLASKKHLKEILDTGRWHGDGGELSSEQLSYVGDVYEGRRKAKYGDLVR